MLLVAAGPTSWGQTWHTWTGAGANNYWSTGGNWINGAPGWLNGYTCFTNPAPDVVTVDMNGVWYNGLQKLFFYTAGYTITDSSVARTGGIRFDNIDDTTDDIVSVGTGINAIEAGFSIGTATGTKVFQVGAGNYLWLKGAVAVNNFTLNGSGTLVIDSPADDTNRNFNAILSINPDATLLLNSIEAMNTDWTTCTVGGNGGILNYGNGVDTDFTGTKFLVGGDGTTAGGPEIGTFTFRSWDVGVTGRSYVDFNAGTTIEMQIAPDGNNDKVVLDLGSPGATTYGMRIYSGVTLNLYGTTIPDGTYTLFENGNVNTANISGTFATVNFNGSPINPANFTLHYNGPTITLDVTGLGPSFVTCILVR